MKVSKLYGLISISLMLAGSVYISGCLNDSNKVEIITALEGKSIAEEVAEGWHKDAKLKDVGSMGDDNNKGGSTQWVYVYFSKSSTKTEDNVTKYEYIHIYVDSDKEVSNTTGWNVITKENMIIKNWSVDSNKAVDIAKQNRTIKSYLNKYEDADLGMTLMMWKSLPNGKDIDNDSATWSVHWEYNPSFAL